MSHYPLAAPRTVLVDVARAALDMGRFGVPGNVVEVTNAVARRWHIDERRMNRVLFGANGVVSRPLSLRKRIARIRGLRFTSTAVDEASLPFENCYALMRAGDHEDGCRCSLCLCRCRSCRRHTP